MPFINENNSLSCKSIVSKLLNYPLKLVLIWILFSNSKLFLQHEVNRPPKSPIFTRRRSSIAVTEVPIEFQNRCNAKDSESTSTTWNLQNDRYAYPSYTSQRSFSSV